MQRARALDQLVDARANLVFPGDVADQHIRLAACVPDLGRDLAKLCFGSAQEPDARPLRRQEPGRRPTDAGASTGHQSGAPVELPM